MTRFALIAVALLAAASAQAAEKKFDRTFTVSPGGTLVVDADAASIRVTGHDSNQLIVHMKAKGTEETLERMTLDAVQNADGVTVTFRRATKDRWFNWGSWDGDHAIEVTVPRRYDLNLRTSGGGIELHDTQGTATARTSGGGITAKNLEGAVELRTSGGGISVDGLRGELDAATSGGSVRLMNIDGKMKGHTSGGSVRASLLGSNRGVQLTTSGGSIELTLPRNVAGDLTAVTSGGGIDTDLPVTTTVAKDNQLRGTVNGGGPPIEARTSGGSIRLRVAD